MSARAKAAEGKKLLYDWLAKQPAKERRLIIQIIYSSIHADYYKLKK